MSDTTPAPEGIDTTTESIPPAYDPTATIVVDPTYRYNRPSPFSVVMTAGALSDKLCELNDSERVRNNLSSTMSEYREANRKVRDYIIKHYNEFDEHAEAIAELLGIELTRTVSAVFQYEVSVEFDVPLSVEIDEDNVLDYIALEILVQGNGVELNNYYESDCSVQSVEVD